MTGQTRRQFLQTSAAVVAGFGLAGKRALGSPFGLPLGLQLYSVREELPKDYEGTLKECAALGYREVEAAGFYGRSAAQVKQAMANAGLHCVSAHYPWSQLSDEKLVDAVIAFHQQLGAHYVICASPGHKDPSVKSHDLSLEDWHWNAEQFNRVGKRVKSAGLQFGYHNHTAEFVKQQDRAGNAVVPFDELIRLTDPALVTFEMDCGWVTVGGGDPAAYLRKYSDRISMLHVKDFQRSPTPMSASKPPRAAELGHGMIDYHTIFAAAKKSQIKHFFVEQEEFFIPWQQALKIDAQYMQGLTA